MPDGVIEKMCVTVIGRVFGVALMTAFAGAGPVLAGPDEHPDCRPGPEVAGSLDAIALNAFGCEPTEPCWQERVQALDELRQRLPRDVHVHRAYQNAVHPAGADDLIDEYRALRDRNPGDPLFLYLLSRVAAGDERAAAAEAALAASPEYPWAQLALMAGHMRQDPPRRDLAFEHLQTFLGLCTASTGPVLAYAGRLGEPEYWRQRLPDIRRRVTGASLAAQLRSTSRLWALEFQLTPPTEHGRVRDRVRQDLERLAKLEADAERPVLRLLATGWELLGDADQLAEVRRRQRVADACLGEVMSRVLDNWAAPHGGEAATRDLTPDLARRLYDASSGWLGECPDSYLYWALRMRAAAMLSGLDGQVLVAEVDRYLAAWERTKELIGTSKSPYRKAAEILLARGIALDRLPGLIAKEREYVRGWRAGQGEAPEPMRARIEAGKLIQDLEIDLLAARVDVALGRVEAAADLLEALGSRVPEAAKMPETDRGSASALRADLLSARAELALAENRGPDAVALWRQAAAELPSSLRRRAGYDARALAVWKELGGSEESFELLSAGGEMPQAAEEMSAWNAVDRPLPPFELVDLEGRTWTLGDLAGSTVLINLWATWCGPCRAELPYIDRLRRGLEDRDRFRVLTFNVDRNPGLILPYLETEGLELDVLLADPWVRDEMGGYAIPQSWILDPQGRVRREQTGFSAEAAASWVGEARRAMAAVRDGGQ